MFVFFFEIVATGPWWAHINSRCVATNVTFRKSAFINCLLFFGMNGTTTTTMLKKEKKLEFLVKNIPNTHTHTRVEHVLPEPEHGALLVARVLCTKKMCWCELINVMLRCRYAYCVRICCLPPNGRMCAIVWREKICISFPIIERFESCAHREKEGCRRSILLCVL